MKLPIYSIKLRFPWITQFEKTLEAKIRKKKIAAQNMCNSA